ncbi:MAG: hypothetical protein ACPGQ5_11120 [Alphaproteobacteria bacterium]
MAMFRYIRRLALAGNPPSATTDGPSRVAMLSAAGITLAVAIFILSA